MKSLLNHVCALHNKEYCMKKYTFVAIVGASGSGKSTMIKGNNKLNIPGLINQYPDLYHYSISTTSRKPRKGEVDGKDFFFKDKKYILDNPESFMEITEFSNSIYALGINQILSENKISITEIDPVGLGKCIDRLSSLNTKHQHLEIKIIFLNTSPEFCVKNMVSTRTTEEVQKRIKEESVLNRWNQLLNDKPELSYVTIFEDEINSTITDILHKKINSLL